MSQAHKYNRQMKHLAILSSAIMMAVILVGAVGMAAVIWFIFHIDELPSSFQAWPEDPVATIYILCLVMALMAAASLIVCAWYVVSSLRDTLAKYRQREYFETLAREVRFGDYTLVDLIYADFFPRLEYSQYGAHYVSAIRLAVAMAATALRDEATAHYVVGAMTIGETTYVRRWVEFVRDNKEWVVDFEWRPFGRYIQPKDEFYRQWRVSVCTTAPAGQYALPSLLSPEPSQHDVTLQPVERSYPDGAIRGLSPVTTSYDFCCRLLESDVYRGHIK